MTIIATLGPLLIALLFGYWVNIKLFTPARVAKGLEQLVYLILGLIGFSLGALDNLAEKLFIAGYQALVLFVLISVIGLTGALSKRLTLWRHTRRQPSIGPNDSKTHALIDALKTIAWVIGGLIIGIFAKDWLTGVDELVTGLLYVLLFLIGCQLRQGNHRLRKLFLNVQGVIIALVTIATTLLAGWVGSLILGLSWNQGLAVVSGFGWYSLSGILITGLGDPVLGTTAFLLDLSREILALMLIPFLARLNSHMSVGYSGATAMDFTLPMLGKFHGAQIVPVCIASGFIMSILVPILIPLFMGIS
ncbi:lysine exporter LysO family protein [Marinomonas rhodophyticola]|uniref:Lysine exporter LysO family protein n=1 Tax=Marinomonas rhodophyticola TaxID=2992803 RepID=A0ABT3KM23_9GAMM|nr:lysine exporter LysO family protein [Marinomonas sp. KJ51-3]MCW4631052.1 lysine exporter LysO family protein [Marinomonas sp. KJ51-3]